MNTPRAWAAAGSALFFALAPGFFAGVVPYWLTGWRSHPLPGYWIPVRVLGGVLIVGGTVVVVQAFVRFVREGVGTPAPVAPPKHLVVGGLYRYVRNPMYVAVTAAVVGQALLLGRFGLLWYVLAVAAAFVAFVRWYEEPDLAWRFGAEYEEYKRGVPAWWPRPRPWQPPAGPAGGSPVSGGAPAG